MPCWPVELRLPFVSQRGIRTLDERQVQRSWGLSNINTNTLSIRRIVKDMLLIAVLTRGARSAIFAAKRYTKSGDRTYLCALTLLYFNPIILLLRHPRCASLSILSQSVSRSHTICSLLPQSLYIIHEAPKTLFLTLCTTQCFLKQSPHLFYLYRGTPSPTAKMPGDSRRRINAKPPANIKWAH